MANPYNLKVIAEFRANGGVVGGDFDGVPLLLLSTKGARSGAARTTPLVHLADGDRQVVFALNGGDPRTPAWFHNLVAHPGDVRVEIGSEAYDAHAVEVVDTAAYEELWRRQIEAEPKFAGFRQRAESAGRRVPLVALVPAAARA